MPEVVFGVIAIAATAAFIREFALRKKQEKDSRASEADKQNYATIGQLTEKSRQIVTQAEKQAQELVQNTKLFSAKATQDLGTQLGQFLQYEEKQTGQAAQTVDEAFKRQEEEFNRFLRHLTEVLDNKTESSINSFSKYLEDLKLESQKSQVANWEGAKNRVNELFENFETKLADFLLQTEQKMMLSVDLELKSARSLIDTYKVQQMNIIDENIVAMLEKTLSLVLAKNLNLRDQMELVYESLERAKTDSFLV
ncbi:MAG TPA: hypothetical protein VJG66_04070 [Patescibacteria group bacterium]|nr:hypothetical protein [Patescibacteria group bacterium]